MSPNICENDITRWQQSFRELPVELFDLIVHSLREDKPSMLACSRVSRLWREVALPHLFASLKVARRSHSSDDFQDFLNTNTDLARTVRRLQLTSPFDQPLFSRPVLSLLDRIALGRIVATLPRLQELHLYMLSFVEGQSPAPGLPDIHPPTRRLEKLTIDYCRSPDIRHTLPMFFNLASIFVSIDTLVLSAFPVVPIPLDPADLIRPLNVGTIVSHQVIQVGSDLLYHALHKALTSGCLCSLQLGGVPWTGTRHQPAALHSFGQLVRHAAQNAHRIDIPFAVCSPVEPVEDDLEHWHSLNLHKCTSLTALTLRLKLPSTDAPADIPDFPLARVCIALLAHVSATLRVLTLMVREVRTHVQIESAEMPGLTELDAVLVGRFERLERVEVMVEICREYADEVNMAGVRLAVSKAMPKLQAKSVLAVVEWDLTRY